MIDLEIKAEIVRAGALSVAVEMLYGGRSQFRSDVTGMDDEPIPKKPQPLKAPLKHSRTYLHSTP